MTDNQLDLLKADITTNTDPVVISALAEGAHGTIAAWYNQLASPDFWRFRSAVPVNGPGGIYNATDWGEWEGLTDAERGGLAMLWRDGSFYPIPDGIRDGLNELLTGAGVTKNAILEVISIKAKYGERVLAIPSTGLGGGNGSDRLAAATPTYEGDITANDVALALQRP